MPHPISLYNTMSRQVEELHPLHEGVVTIYTCGPTVYNDQQVGNYRTYINEDVLEKTLQYFGYTVDRVMNITDVGHLTSDQDEGEDKLEVGAKREGKTAWEVATYYEQRFLEDLKAFRIAVPKKLIKATDTITEQIEFIKGLEAKGFTYQIADGIYFDTNKVSDYGRLARLDLEGQQAGARIGTVEGKRNPIDFALWKFSPTEGKRDMEWESPWGKGFPGWHIECSAIILKSLGESIDIHAGGADHIPVHHTNEIAQSESLTGKPLASIWFHNEFLLADGGKMSKSLGNGYTLSDLNSHGIDPLAFRLFTYSASYRSKLNFTWEALEGAKSSLHRLKELVMSLSQPVDQGGEEYQKYVEQAEAALADDLNMPTLIAIVWEVVRSELDAAEKALFVQKFEPILSLGLFEAEKEIEIPEAIRTLLQQRNQARAEKNWAEADRLREEITAVGFVVVDQPDGKSVLKPLS